MNFLNERLKFRKNFERLEKIGVILQASGFGKSRFVFVLSSVIMKRASVTTNPKDLVLSFTIGDKFSLSKNLNLFVDETISHVITRMLFW